jgi:Uma2 family endonuclease
MCATSSSTVASWRWRGGPPEHGARAAAIIAAVSAQLRGKPCRVHTSDVRVRVRASGLDTYPDVSVVCGHAEVDSEDPNALTIQSCSSRS